VNGNSVGYCRECGRDVDLIPSAHRGQVLGEHYRNRMENCEGQDYNFKCGGTLRAPTRRPPEDTRHAFENEGNFEEAESVPASSIAATRIDRQDDTGVLRYGEELPEERDAVFGYRKPETAAVRRKSFHHQPSPGEMTAGQRDEIEQRLRNSGSSFDDVMHYIRAMPGTPAWQVQRVSELMLSLEECPPSEAPPRGPFRGPSANYTVVDDIEPALPVGISTEATQLDASTVARINGIDMQTLDGQYVTSFIDETFLFDVAAFQREMDAMRTAGRPGPVIRDAQGNHTGTHIQNAIIDEPFFSVPEIRSMLDRCGMAEYNIHEIEARRYPDDVHWIPMTYVNWSLRPVEQLVPVERIGGCRIWVKTAHGIECDISSVVTGFTEYRDDFMRRHVRFE
jgi:hypothetical protein